MAHHRRRLPFALLLLMVAVAWPGAGAPAAPKIGVAPPVAQASVAAVEPEAAAPSFEPAFAPAVAPPARLQIPALRLDAMVEALGVDGSGAMDTPRNIWNVGWYSPGPSPGASGDAVIDGHVGLPGHPLVFSELARLGIGADVIVVLADGTRNRFLVTRIRILPSNASPGDLFTTAGPPRLSLITCTGRYDAGSRTYGDRLIVEAAYAGAD